MGAPHLEHRVWHYLLRGLAIKRADLVWCADITFIPVCRGFLYPVAIMDWASRHVLAWRLSNTLDMGFCTDALEEALMCYGAPANINTNQGSRFRHAARQPDPGRRRNRDHPPSARTTRHSASTSNAPLALTR